MRGRRVRRPPGGRKATPTGSESGAAVVEYLLVAILVVMVFIAVGQIAVLIHARNVLVADAAEGAREAALRGSSLAAGEQECRALIVASLPGLAGSAVCHAAVVAATPAAPPLVDMAAAAQVRVWLLPGGRMRLRVSARAVLEPPA